MVYKRRRRFPRRRRFKRRVRKSLSRGKRFRSRMRRRSNKFRCRVRGHKVLTLNGTIAPYKVAWHEFHDVLSNLTFFGPLLELSSSYVYRANSVYDPKYSASGTFNQTASYYNWFSKLYGRYMVVKSEIVATMRQQSPVQQTLSGKTANYKPLRWGIMLNDDTNVDNYSTMNWTNMIQQPNSVHGIACGNNNHDAVSTLKCTFDARRDLANYSRTTAGGNVGGNPSGEKYFQIWYQVQDMVIIVGDSHVVPEWGLDVYIKYKVIWSNAQDITGFKNETFEMAQS